MVGYVNCEKGCVSWGGDDRLLAPPVRGGLRRPPRWDCSPEPLLGGVTVPSLNSSVAVESALCVTGDGSGPCFRCAAWSVGEVLRSDRRGFLGSTCSPCDCCGGCCQPAIA